MKGRIFAVIFLICAVVTSISADGKCKLLPTEDDRSITYSCVEVTFDHVEDISNQATWIEFSVSKLHIPKEAFARFSLRSLFFYNCDMKYIHPNAFDGLVDLELLTFYGSNINVLSASWFRDLKRLTHLSLEKNNLMYIEPKTFLEVPRLQYLNIENNNLNCLSEHALTPLRYLKHVRIGKNPWLCSCHDELINWMLKKHIDFGEKNSSQVRFECMLVSYTSTDMEQYEVSRDSSTLVPASLTASMPENGMCMGKTLSVLSSTPDNVQSIRLSGVKISTIPEFAFFQFGNSLRSLDLSNCSITEIHPEAFAGLPKLERLILYNNSLSTVKAEWFKDLRSLKHLELNRNGIQNFESNVFLLLDKLESLSLERNGIECLDTNTVGLMRHLKKINISKNPWNCGCLNNFMSWLSRNQIAQHASLGQCTNEMSQIMAGQYGSGYWSNSSTSSFEQNSSKDKTITNYQNFTETHTSTGFKDGSPTEIQSYYHQSQEAAKNAARYQRNERSSNDGRHVTIGEQQQQQQQKNVPNCRTSTSRGLQITYSCPLTCNRVEQPLFPTRYFYKCFGETLFGLNAVEEVAESITIEHSTISVIPNYAFARFGQNLRSLKLLYCRIEQIEPQAFAGLVNLQELILQGNNIQEVKSAWFESTRNLQRLVLTENSISRIEKTALQFLRNLEHFGISDNQLNCIGTDVLSHTPKLKVIDLIKNPWSCLCQKKLTEWMNDHNVSYDPNFASESPYWDCGFQLPSPTLPTFRPPSFTPQTSRPPLPILPTSQPSSFTPPTSRPPEPTLTMPRPPSPTVPPLPLPLPSQCTWDPPNWSHCVCIGADYHVLNEIPSNVERIEIRNSAIPHLTSDIFARFTNLKELLLYNCSIRKIDDSAFRGLRKLELLVLQDNSISTIKSVWFRNLTALTDLDLSRNHVMEIEGDAFKYLSNLRVLSLKDNDVQCIYTNSLNASTKLQEVLLQNNPWKWRCLEELMQFLRAHNVRFTHFGTYRGKRIACELKKDKNSSGDNGATNTSISTVNVLCVSIAMLIFTKF